MLIIKHRTKELFFRMYKPCQFVEKIKITQSPARAIRPLHQTHNLHHQP